MNRPDLIVEFNSRPGSLAVEFPYDALAVSLIKTIPGRRYDKDTKIWHIPSGSLRALQQEAARRGFNIVLSERLRIAQNHGQQDKAELRRAKEMDDSPLLICTEAGAYAITLTAADIIIHLDQPWNPAVLRQREDRLHRLGQKGNVQVVSFIARRTVDELVRKIIHRKLKLLREVFQEDAEDTMVGQAVTRADIISLLGGK